MAMDLALNAIILEVGKALESRLALWINAPEQLDEFSAILFSRFTETPSG